jgi:hypothetical protein
VLLQLAKYGFGIYHIAAIAGFDADVDLIAQSLVTTLIGLLDRWRQ